MYCMYSITPLAFPYRFLLTFSLLPPPLFKKRLRDYLLFDQRNSNFPKKGKFENLNKTFTYRTINTSSLNKWSSQFVAWVAGEPLPPQAKHAYIYIPSFIIQTQRKTLSPFNRVMLHGRNFLYVLYFRPVFSSFTREPQPA